MPKTLVCPLRIRVVVCISAWLVLAVAAPAQIRNRILQNIGDTEPVVVSAPHPLARAEFDRGRVEGSLMIDHAAMVFKLAPTQQAALDKLLAEQQDPHSPNFRKWLTPEQYAARFGMSDSDLAKVTAWLKSQGLRVDGFSRGRTQVFFSGTADQVGDAFHTEFHRYLVNAKPAWRMRSRSRFHKRFPGWCWAFAASKISARGPECMSWPGRTSPRTRPGTTSSPQETLPPSTAFPPGWMGRGRPSRLWDRPRSTLRTLTLSAPHPDCQLGRAVTSSRF